MRIRQSKAFPAAVLLSAVGLIGVLTGFDKPNTAAPQPVVTTAPQSASADVELTEVAKRMMTKDNVVGALLLGKNGEIIPVDANGRVVPGCALPKARTDGDKAVTANECAKTRGTTITDLQPVSIVRHTGSTCITVGTVFGGKYWTYQIPKGCTP